MEEGWQSGGCYCGDVRYRVRGPAVWKAGCTCTTCVKMHAAPYVVWAGFDRGSVEVNEGEPRAFQSSPYVVREFCGRCGSTLIYRKVARGVAELERAARLVYIAVASLDDPTAFAPDEIVHSGEKISWLNLDGSIPAHDFISPDAGHLQFGGLDPDAAQSLARRHFSDGEDES